MGIRRYLASDVGFYVGVGVLIILVFVVAVGIGLHQNVMAPDRQLIPFVVGFLLFMAVYFASIAVLRLRPEDR